MLVSPLDLVERLQREHFADSSFTHAELKVKQQGGTVILSGTVLDRPTAEFLLGTLHQRLPAVNWRDEMTPLVTGPDYSWAISTRAVMDVRREPSNATERVSQIIYGEPVEILRLAGDWAFVRLRDGYLGWTRHKPLRTFSAEAVHEWIAGATHLVRQPLLACFADRSGDPHQQVMLLPFGARLNVEGADGPFRGIRCPDGVLRWVPATGLLPIGELWHTGAEGIRTVANWAQALIGVPYLWGGKTPFGYDCSGLVQTFYGMIGVHLRRDAHQQAAEGHGVDFDERHFGDLLFLDNDRPEADLHVRRHDLAVTHVIMALDGDDFLHAVGSNGGVVRGSFDSHSPWYARTYRERIIAIRRYV